jgi:PKD repeat protein
MKTLKSLVIAAILCLGQFSFAQETMENPTAAEDIKVVADYIYALMTNKMEVASELVADDFVGSGPANGDTQNKSELITSWTEINKIRTNKKNDYVSHSFRVKGGDLEGDWVSVWGTYYYSQNNVDIVLPYQYTAEIKNGKMQRGVIYYDNLAVADMMGYELTEKKK